MPADTWEVAGARVEVTRGDLTDQRVDGVVNAANTELWLGAGVAGAIRARGGPEVQSECDRHGPIPLGQAAVTGAGRLPACFVIHAAAMPPGGVVTADALASATRNALRCAQERGLSSLALPAIGTGVGGFPLPQCAGIMMREADAHLRAHAQGPLRLVRFVLFSETARDEFARAAHERWGQGAPA